MNMNSDTFTKQ